MAVAKFTFKILCRQTRAKFQGLDFPRNSKFKNLSAFCSTKFYKKFRQRGAALRKILI